MATDLKLWVQVNDAADEAPIADAAVTGTFSAVSDQSGAALADMLSLTVTRDGYVPYVEQPYLAPSGVAPIPIHLEAKPAPPAIVLPELTTRGHSFQQADGTFWTAIQCSDFNLLNRFQHEDITPILAQRQACGFNLLRVWTAFDIPGIGTFRDLDYTRIPAFVAQCAAYGLYVEFCAYTGINDPGHWDRLCDAARQCHPRPLLELVNELDQNTNEPDDEGRVFHLADYHKPEGLLASHGSNGSEAWPVQEYWDYLSFHTNGAYEEVRKVGHNAWEIWNGPVITNETSRYPEVGMWRGRDLGIQQQLAYDAAAGGALLPGGSCFHFVSGKTSVLMTEDEQAVASAWCAGARSVRLDYQDGRYIRRDDLLNPALMRVYERRYDDNRGGEIVEIRNVPLTRDEVIRAREVEAMLTRQWLAGHPREEAAA